MKILHIACIGHHAEGIGTVLQKLVPEQLSLGQDVRIITVCVNQLYSNLPIVTITRRINFLKYLSLWMPDIVVFHSMYEMIYIQFYKVLINLNIPYLVQMHGALSISNYRKNYIRKLIANYLFFNTFLKKAAGIIYLNEQEYNNCVVKEINPLAVIIPNGCDLRPFSLSQEQSKLPLEIVYVGRIAIVHKALDVLVEAIRIIQLLNVENIHFSFYGNGDRKEQAIFSESLNGLEKYAEFKGAIFGDEKVKIMTSCNMFILTSRYEGMPMGVLEALSFGIPCILTPGTNLADSVEIAGAGWKTECVAQAIAECIIRSANEYSMNPQKFHRAAYEISKKYDWRTIAVQSLNCYRRFCGIL